MPDLLVRAALMLFNRTRSDLAAQPADWNSPSIRWFCLGKVDSAQLDV